MNRGMRIGVAGLVAVWGAVIAVWGFQHVGSGSPSAADASYVRAHQDQLSSIQLGVEAVEGAVIKAGKSGSVADADVLATDAQQVHDALAQYKGSLAGTTSTTAALLDAVNGLKNGMGAMVAFAGAPNPATMAQFSTQFNPAVAEWNSAVSTLWVEAKLAGPPTLTGVSSSG